MKDVIVKEIERQIYENEKLPVKDAAGVYIPGGNDAAIANKTLKDLLKFIERNSNEN